MNPRVKNHLALGGATTAALGISLFSGPAAGMADRLSIVSAYLCLVLLGVALSIGPLNAMRRGRPLVNSYVRRDTGIWAALNGLGHFFLANVLAMNYEYLGIYVENPALPPSTAVREELYLWGTILGYLVAVLFVVLLSLSNDWMLRKLGTKWWKCMQRSSYAAFLFTCVHAFAFQVLETRAALWVSVVSFITIWVLVQQGLGIGATRKRRAGGMQEATAPDG